MGFEAANQNLQPMTFRTVDDYISGNIEKNKNILFHTKISQKFLAEVVSILNPENNIFYDIYLRIFYIEGDEFKHIFQREVDSFSKSKIDKIQNEIVSMVNKYEANIRYGKMVERPITSVC